MSDEVQDVPIDATAAESLARRGLRFATIRSSDESYDPWFQAMVRGFHGPAANAESLEDRRHAFADRRICGVWDDSLADAATPVATASSWIMDLTVSAQRTIPSWAISTITVAPTHRRRGIARDLMEAELRTARRLGVPVAILTASEATIYERFGFAPAAMRADYLIDAQRAKWIGRAAPGRVQLVTHEQARDGGGYEVVERAVKLVPGQLHFGGHLWNRLFGIPGQTDPAERRVVRYDDSDGTAQGLAIYKMTGDDEHDTADVLYLAAATDDAYAALWRYLLELDLLRHVKADLRSTDEPFRWQISDFRAAVQHDVHDQLWVRILDVKAALEARAYSAAGVIGFEITDPLGFSDGCFVLEIDDAGSGIAHHVENPAGFGDNHHLQLGVNELAAAYLGATSFSTLAHAGRVNEKTPAAAVAADAAFRSPRTPWSSIWF